MCLTPNNSHLIRVELRGRESQWEGRWNSIQWVFYLPSPSSFECEQCIFFLQSDELQTRTEYFTKLYSINPIKFWMISDLHLVTEYSKSFTAFNGLSQMDKVTWFIAVIFPQIFWTLFSMSDGSLSSHGWSPTDDQSIILLCKKWPRWVDKFISLLQEII